MAVFDLRGKRVFVAGHRGMVGSALVRRLASEDCEVLTVPRQTVDLRDQRRSTRWLRRTGRTRCFMAAATVGGIYANDSQPGGFSLRQPGDRDEHRSMPRYRMDVEKLMFFGSTCIYPRLAPQPMPEDALLTGPLEPTNQWYAVAKIAGLKLCEAYRRQYGCDFVSVMPTNLYGPGDNFDPLVEPCAAGADAPDRRGRAAPVGRQSRFGAAASRAANSSTSTTSPTPRSF